MPDQTKSKEINRTMLLVSIAVMCCFSSCNFVSPLEMSIDFSLMNESAGRYREYQAVQLHSNIPGCPARISPDDAGRQVFSLTGPLPDGWYVMAIPVVSMGNRTVNLAPWGCVVESVNQETDMMQSTLTLAGGAAAMMGEHLSSMETAACFNIVRCAEVLRQKGLDGVSLDFRKVWSALESGSFSSWSLSQRQDCTGSVMPELPPAWNDSAWMDAAGRRIGTGNDAGTGRIREGVNILLNLDGESDLLRILVLECVRDGDGTWQVFWRQGECPRLPVPR